MSRCLGLRPGTDALRDLHCPCTNCFLNESMSGGGEGEGEDWDEEGEEGEDDDFDEQEAADFLRAAEEGNLDGVQIVKQNQELLEVQDEV
jgi:hypothetical protein